MAKGVTTVSDLQENEWTQSIGTVVWGIGLMIVAALLMYFMNFWFAGTALMLGRLTAGLAILIGVSIAALGIKRAVEAKKVAAVTFPCPYCDQEMRFIAMPTEDFDCEYCNRTVHFENGHPVEVRIVMCQACRTEHRVAVNVQRYVCDRCNRPLQLAAPTGGRRGAVEEPEDAMLQNYDVLLVAFDRRKENELAFKIQNLLVVNLPDARRLIETVSSQAPLIVGYGLPQRKAEAVRRQLTELGATATLRPSRTGTRT